MSKTPVVDLRSKLQVKQSKRRCVFLQNSVRTQNDLSDYCTSYENKISLEVNERKRSYEAKDIKDDFGKRFCNNNRISLVAPQNLIPTGIQRRGGKVSFTSVGKSEATIGKSPENKWSSRQHDKHDINTACDDQNNDQISKKLRIFHNDQREASTRKESGHQCSNRFRTGESMHRNFDTQNATTTSCTPISYTCLKHLCDPQVSPEDASSKLSEIAQLQRFEALLRKSEIRYGLMKLIISVIYKVCQSRIPAHLNRILGIMNKVRFWSTLSEFIVELETKKECLLDTHVSSTLENVCKILSTSLERLPQLYSRIPIYQLQNAVHFFKENGHVPIDSTLDSLLTELTCKCELVKKGIREKGQSEAEPPDDFRLLSVIPTVEDIFKRGKPFLRENNVKKPFLSVEQYLDIHFRLLKEDSIAGLRNGIRDLQRTCRHQQYGETAVNSLSKSSIATTQKDVIVYNEVIIKEQVQARNRGSNIKGIVYNVEFNSKHPSIKRINWVRSKRLLFGSLVCLISTDFNKVHFATVQDRTADMLKEGYIQLCFEGNECPGYDEMGEKYHMLESSSAYFVAYRHILERLQDIKEETMPFKNYIVFCEHEIDKPTYLKKKSEEEDQKTINLESAKPKENHLKLWQLTDEDETSRLKNVSPYDLNTWPNGDVIGLNDSQYKAFQSALQREFVVIQGPPGTGKTYLGLKIAHTLLDNSHLWKEAGEENSCPILMLAYTNHALDSFLEGLVINRKDIIRVGGRSSSDVLTECNINTVRRERRKTGYLNGVRRFGGRRLREVESEKEACQAKLNRYSELYSKSFKGILPAREFLKTEHMKYLSKKEDMLKFLGISLNSAAKQNTPQFTDEEDYDELHGDELEGYFYVGHAEDDEKQHSKNEVLICFAEETSVPASILEILKADAQEFETAERLEERTNGVGIFSLGAKERWSLYLLWLVRLRAYLRDEIKKEQTKYLDLSNEYEELRNIEDLGILRNARVVGMTTTCASRSHKLLRQLRPRVVIVEEAAELFEAHVVTCLTEHCQHLILIGDHQQLRPNPSFYDLSLKYNLDVSLLERMIEVGVPYNRLSVQHRMRPEISNIFRHIYPGLEDHASVKEYAKIRGVSKNLFFIDHDVHESDHDNIHSKFNQHEAEFLVELCLYLLRQSYKSSQITILTTYTGQMFLIRDLIKSNKDEFEDNLIRVSTVDNFQGEENDIILLSLVRNNADKNIGFLKTNNRVCVALSRARKGLYIIGNRNMLSNQSPLWKAVLADLDKSGCIGKSLPVTCSNHQTENLVSSAEDFRTLVPNGGCQENCQHRLDCGHACPQMCHPSGHENFICKKSCTKNVSSCNVSGHKCTKPCHEICDIICLYPVSKVLSCGHEMTLACSDDVNSAKCKEQCAKTLDCGHRCQASCSVPCTQKCMELVKKTDLSCGHESTMACSATQKDCRVPCNISLECGHPCGGRCGQCIQGRVHVKCVQECNRSLVCSHLCKSSCTKNCPPCKANCARKCIHSNCNKACGEICIPCKEPCEWECEHHKCTRLCSDICDRPRCNQPCKRKLPCGDGRAHICRGLCGEKCICTICNTNNGEDVTAIFFGTEDEEHAKFIMLNDCGHIFEYTALDQMMDTIDNEIKPKVCPRCTVPIVESLRYGNVVKNVHNDIDNIKRKILGNETQLEEKKILVLKLAYDLICKIALISMNMKPIDIERSWKTIANYLERICKSSSVYYQDILLLESEMHLLKNWYMISSSYEEGLKSQYQNRSCSHIEFESEMQNVLSRILVLPAKTSARILNQLNLELQRLSLKRDILLIKLNCASLRFTLDDDDEEIITRIEKVLRNKETIEEDFIQKFKEGISDISARNPQLSPITREEKLQIVHAIGLKQGHWFKCPNGHSYAIGECGGAMEKSKCPECGADIGGQNHRLADDNELDHEMDGATYPAWSDQANMQNYQFDD